MTELSLYCQKIVFINCFDNYLENDKNFIEALEIEVLTIENLGHDFGMWQRATQQWDIEKYEYVLFANDSCVLVEPLAPFFDWHKNTQPSFAGMINSNENGFHLQSYFTIYNRPAFAVLNRKFKKVGFVENKRRLIKKYEIGLTKAMHSIKIETQSFFKIPAEQKTNPLFHNLPELLKNGFPFVKKQIFFDQLAMHDRSAFATQHIDLSIPFIATLLAMYCSTFDVDWQAIQKDMPEIEAKNGSIELF